MRIDFNTNIVNIVGLGAGRRDNVDKKRVNGTLTTTNTSVTTVGRLKQTVSIHLRCFKSHCDLLRSMGLIYVAHHVSHALLRSAQGHPKHG
jgi:hypothetical protein